MELIRIFILFSAFTFITISSYAKIIFVDDNASAGGKGTSWASARKYLQDALASAEYGDEIWVAEGTYKPNLWLKKSDGNKYDSFNLVNGVGMYGGFKGTETERTPLGDSNKTILSGEISDDISEWSLRVLTGADLDLNTTLEGFKITRGRASKNGGGIYLASSSPVIRNCNFISNYSGGSGGGMTIGLLSSPTIENCLFMNNSAYAAGGMKIETLTSPTIINCKFLNNTADNMGGAIRNLGGSCTPTFINCVFEGNSAGNTGGGIQNNNSNSSYFNCIFNGNSAGFAHPVTDSKGGAIYNDASPILMNCIFTENTVSNSRAGARGGAIFTTTVSGNGAIIKNCIFYQNSAVGISDFRSGGGGAFFGATKYPSIVNNCIFWKNVTHEEIDHGCGDEDSNSWKSDAVPEADNILQGWQGDTRAFTSDPLFIDIDNPRGPDEEWFTSDDGFQVQIGSPAIDNGHNILLPDDDLDWDRDGKKIESFPVDVLGLHRFQGESIDIGAYEYPDENVNISIKSIPAGAGHVEGGGIFPRNSAIVLSIKSVLPGYRFTGWDEDINKTSNTLSFIAESSRSITANFALELNDSDGDGLSDYEEIAVFGTSMDKNDTDNDGLLDKEEIDIGSDPNRSDKNLFRHLKSLAEKSILSNVSSYGLITKDAYDKMMNELMSASDTDTTPYSEGWFYLPSQGWLWTTRTAYPYFFDSTTKAWMFFQSGNEKPRFYHYGTKEWMTVE